METDRDRAALIANEIPGADPTKLSIAMVNNVLADNDVEHKTQKQAKLCIACRRWLGIWGAKQAATATDQ